MNAKKNVPFAIACLLAGFSLMTIGTKSMATYCYNCVCGYYSSVCGTYTTCAQFYGNCGAQSDNPGAAYNSLVNDPRIGGMCVPVPGGTGCNSFPYTCSNKYYADTACKVLACTNSSYVVMICP
jgi:hypothetical protein